MKRSLISISVVMVSAALFASGCKKSRTQENSSIPQSFSGQPGSSTGAPTQGTAPAAPQGTSGSTTGNTTTGATGTTASGSSGSSTTSMGTAPIAPGGSGGAPLPVAPTAQVAQAPEAPKEIPVTCFVESFKHKPTPGHESEEACSHHKNLLKLSHSDINMKSVCVRVNDVPVKFDRGGHGNEFVIGSIAGPQSVITVKYCTGKTACAETKKDDCVVPKDEFLDAIGGGDPDDGAVAKWDNTDTAGDAKLNSDVKRELADIDDTATDNHGANASIFKDWIAEKPAPACAADKKHSS